MLTHLIKRQLYVDAVADIATCLLQKPDERRLSIRQAEEFSAVRRRIVGRHKQFASDEHAIRATHQQTEVQKQPVRYVVSTVQRQGVFLIACLHSPYRVLCMYVCLLSVCLCGCSNHLSSLKPPCLASICLHYVTF